MILTLNISNKSNPQILDTFSDSGLPHELYSRDGILYLTDLEDGLEIYDISNPSNISEIYQYLDGSLAHGLHVRDNILFFAGYNNDNPDLGGLKILNISNPYNPVLINNYTEVGNIWRVMIYENYAFVNDNDFNEIILDISDLTNITEIARYNIGMTLEIIIKNDIAYMACYDQGLKAYNISNPGEITLLWNYSTYDSILDFDIYNDYIFVPSTSSSNGLAILEINNSEKPEKITETEKINSLGSITIVENYLYYSESGKLFISKINIQEDNENQINGFQISTLIVASLLISKKKKKK